VPQHLQSLSQFIQYIVL